MNKKDTAKYEDLANIFKGQTIKDFLASGGTLAELNEAKDDFANWADATAEFEWQRHEEQNKQSEFINLFTGHPY